jgi:hypothetical protein
MDHSTHHLKPPSPLFPLPLPPFQTRVDKENASSGSQDLRLYLRMQADRRCYSAHSTTNLDPQQLPRINETETISPIKNRLPSRPLPSPRPPWSTEISRSAETKGGSVLGGQEDDEPRVLRRGPRGFLPVTRSRRLPVLAQYATDRMDRCWPWSVCPAWKRVSMGGCNKGSLHTRKSELYYCILEWMRSVMDNLPFWPLLIFAEFLSDNNFKELILTIFEFN